MSEGVSFKVRWPENNKKHRAAWTNRASRNALCIRTTVLNFSSFSEARPVENCSVGYVRTFILVLASALFGADARGYGRGGVKTARARIDRTV